MISECRTRYDIYTNRRTDFTGKGRKNILIKYRCLLEEGYRARTAESS